MEIEEAREWIEVAENTEYDESILEWTAGLEGYIKILSAASYGAPYRVENRRKVDLEIFERMFDHTHNLRAGKDSILVNHDYSSTILSPDTFKYQLLDNLSEVNYNGVYLWMSPVAPYARGGHGLVTIISHFGYPAPHNEFTRPWSRDLVEVSSDIFGYSRTVMAAITFSGHQEDLDFRIAKAFHLAAGRKYNFDTEIRGEYYV